MVELLAVIGIIALLIGILLPALAKARSQSQAVRCMSNIRQLGIALKLYAGDNKDNYPINVSSPQPRYWNDVDRIGQYLPIPSTAMDGSSVFWCPADDGAQQSYAMNVWASSAADKTVTALKTGQLWAHRRPSSSMLLLAESWSYQTGAGQGFLPTPIIGKYGTTAGQRFGALGGIGPIAAGRWGPVNTEITYARHRRSQSQGYATQSTGRVMIFFDDGHVGLCSDTELIDYFTGKSAGLAAWSALDYFRN